jgi:hypothetical protein
MGATNTGSSNFFQVTDAVFADGAFSTNSDANGNTVLNFATVPEPASTAFLAFGVLGLSVRRRRTSRLASTDAVVR